MPIQATLRAPRAAGDPVCAEALPADKVRERRHATGPMDCDAMFRSSAPAPLLAQDSGADIADGDWNDLFDAVKERLLHSVSESGFGPGPLSESGIAQVRNTVLDCISALDLLQLSVSAERLRREGLQTAVFEAQTSLAQVRAALVGTQLDERRARHDASHDSLTQLPNRGFLLKRIDLQLNSAVAGEREFAVMFLDLNGFKQVNDDHGHAVGDAVLHIVAARLRRAIRARDVVSRVGGDEFVCMIGGVADPAQLAQLANKILQAISAPCAVGRLQLVVHASIGIATSPVDASDAKALLERADIAMIAAKRQHVRHAFFSRDDLAGAPARQGVASDGDLTTPADSD